MDGAWLSFRLTSPCMFIPPLSTVDPLTLWNTHGPWCDHSKLRRVAVRGQGSGGSTVPNRHRTRGQVLYRKWSPKCVPTSLQIGEVPMLLAQKAKIEGQHSAGLRKVALGIFWGVHSGTQLEHIRTTMALNHNLKKSQTLRSRVGPPWWSLI